MPIKRFLLIAIMGIVTAFYFWTQSRYPDLNQKALMAESGTVADTISARPIYIVQATDPFYKKVWLTSINWAHDNRKGMMFGVFFAAILMSLASYLPMPKENRRVANTLYGFLVGAPLGVCVNCAAPIFKGMLKSARLETAFAAMLSSPTMNIVVLTMVFSLFPFYMAITKVLFCLVAIFIGVPLISRLLGDEQRIKDFIETPIVPKFLEPPTAQQSPSPIGNESWFSAVRWGGLDLLKNLWFIFSRTVPLMLVAGFLGSLLSYAVPLNMLAGQDSFGTLVVAAVAGIMLPVPMAFDVMLVNALYSHGASVGVSMVLLCTLGIFSVYSFFITWQSTSSQWAIALTLLLASMGLGAGAVAPGLHDRFYVKPNMQDYQSLRARSLQASSAIDLVSTAPVPRMVQQAPREAKRWNSGSVAVESFPYLDRPSGAGFGFTFLEGHEVGLTRGFRYGIRDYPDPFWIGRGTAAGDFNRDGWIDVAFGTESGAIIYVNRGGWFETLAFPVGSDLPQNTYAVAFVDFDNDGWLDFFWSSFEKGNYLIRNKDGQFDFAGKIQIPNNNSVLTVSPGFADFDHNGYVDVLNGNMSLGIITGFNSFSPRRASSVAMNDQFGFRDQPLLTDLGETMASLVSDLNADGALDIYLGHDFIFPDSVVMSLGRGVVPAIENKQLLPATPVYTMGIDSGDLNNDLRLDLAIFGTIQRRTDVGKSAIDGVPPSVYGVSNWTVEACQSIQDPVVRQNCITIRTTEHMVDFHRNRNLSVSECRRMKTPAAQQDCLLSTMWLLVTNEDRKWDCKADFKDDELLYSVCVILKEKAQRRDAGEFSDAMPQRDGNYVYLAQDNGSFIDINSTEAKAFDHPGGWTWGARIADFDHDGWQDIFSAEGAIRSHDYGFNVYMKNIDGKRFEQKQFSLGLTSKFGLYSFSVLDFDADGDLDIIGNSSIGPVQVFRNDLAADSQGISFAVHRGRFSSIGAKIIITGSDGIQQMREIKASGGYQSFDPEIAHFGMAKTPEVKEVQVVWTDGTVSTATGPFAVGHMHRLSFQ